MGKKTTFADVKGDLVTLQRLLSKYFAENILNVQGIEKAITQLTQTRNGKLCFEDAKLEFINLNLGKDIRPILDSEQYNTTVLELRFTKLEWFSYPSQPINDPINNFELQLILKIKDTEKLLAKSAWHFEKHPDKKDDGTPEATPEFHHPLYHLHFGGYELTDDEDIEYGNIMVIEAPRIMHPPLDMVLAIDFVLNNFYSCQSFMGLISEPDYIRIVRNARERFWKPFAFGFASNFTTNHNFRSESQVSVVSTYAKNLITYSETH
ncbi:MAG TPA: hypothetical protein PKA00_01790 [Saprospiraceae bacterium]|nr:hypothetical protein [Saprospiraceae bacterium]HMQ81602.1 hypothetical protein [Saprospiraceae bacterium]